MVIPKTEIDYLFDIDDEVLGRMIQFAKTVAIGLKKAIPCKRIGVTVIGLEVPHAHIHLIPISKESDIYFGKPKLQKTSEALAQTATLIREQLV